MAERVGDKCKNHAAKCAGDEWETIVKSCGQSTHKELETAGDKWETSEKIMRPKHPQEIGDSGEQVGDKWETSVKSCGHSNYSVAGTQARRQM